MAGVDPGAAASWWNLLAAKQQAWEDLLQPGPGLGRVHSGPAEWGLIGRWPVMAGRGSGENVTGRRWSLWAGQGEVEQR